jgi:hypothetical protein
MILFLVIIVLALGYIYLKFARKLKNFEESYLVLTL